MVSDSIEGWAHAVNLLIESYLHRGYYEDYYDFKFDFSLIRKKGAPISSGGNAPGHEPLAKALEEIDKLLSRLVLVKMPRLRSIDGLRHHDAPLRGGPLRWCEALSLHCYL